MPLLLLGTPGAFPPIPPSFIPLSIHEAAATVLSTTFLYFSCYSPAQSRLALFDDLQDFAALGRVGARDKDNTPVEFYYESMTKVGPMRDQSPAWYRYAYTLRRSEDRLLGPSHRASGEFGEREDRVRVGGLMCSRAPGVPWRRNGEAGRGLSMLMGTSMLSGGRGRRKGRKVCGPGRRCTRRITREAGT